jgi:hypothetical protein
MTTLGELAKVLELELRGDPARSIASLAALESATAGDLSFVSEKKHLPKGIRNQRRRAHLASRLGRCLGWLRVAEHHALCGFCQSDQDLR